MEETRNRYHGRKASDQGKSGLKSHDWIAEVSPEPKVGVRVQL